MGMWFPQTVQVIRFQYWEELRVDVSNLPHTSPADGPTTIRTAGWHQLSTMQCLETGSFPHWTRYAYDDLVAIQPDVDHPGGLVRVWLNYKTPRARCVCLYGVPRGTKNGMKKWTRGLEARGVLHKMYEEWTRKHWTCREHSFLEQKSWCWYCLMYKNRRQRL